MTAEVTPPITSPPNRRSASPPKVRRKMGLVNDALDDDHVYDNYDMISDEEISIDTQTEHEQQRKQKKAAIGLAVAFLVSSTVNQRWGDEDLIEQAMLDPKTALLANLPSLRRNIKSLHGLPFLRRSPSVRTAAMLLERGLTILVEEDDSSPSSPSAGHEDLRNVLDAADVSFSDQMRSADEAILCFQLMVPCFLILREPSAALSSIFIQLRLLFDVEGVKRSMGELKACLECCAPGGRARKVMFREDKARLDLLWSRVCAATAVCERLSSVITTPTGGGGRHVGQYISPPREGGGGDIESCRSLAPGLDDLALVLGDSERWDKIRVYKMARGETYAVAALPAAAVVVADPLLAAAAMLCSATLSPSRMPVFAKHLSQFDANETGRRNFYDLRQQIRNVCLGRPPFFQTNASGMGQRP